MFELQALYGDPADENLLNDPSRKFLFEEPLNIISLMKNLLSVICYFLSDMILITELQDTGQRLKKIIYLDSTTILKKL